jgi:signal transduction histidine kinase
MSLLQRYRWFVAAAGVTLAFAAVSVIAREGPVLTAFADLSVLAAMLFAAAVAFRNTTRRPDQERSFWALMALGFALWACNQAAWSYCELILHQKIPDPFFFDIVLFFHTVPMIAAVAWRPDLIKKAGRVHLSVLNFLMLLGWWVFLYSFVVFPHQYVTLDVRSYNIYYDLLYLVEHVWLLAALGLAAWTSSGGWRRLYLQLFAAASVYSIGSQFLDRAATNGTYYSGSLYDVPLVASLAWMAAAVISVREWELTSTTFDFNRRWRKFVPQAATLAILSLPVLGVWALLFDKSEELSKVFRIFAVLAAMLLLGAFVFLRQYFQDQDLIGVLRESRRAYETQKHLQSQLVQKEKLASLGNLVAGAAHEIHYPLTSILNCSEHIWSKEPLTAEQDSLVRKIVTQAMRTRDLVTDLLSFAQKTPGEKVLADVSMLLNRAIQMLEAQRPGGRTRVKLSINADFPKVRGNANQLFQAFIEIIENAFDAIQDSGAGAVEIKGVLEGSEVVLQFSDNGPGILEPAKVFDPFYTTKPVGKGTGLGLSAVYGVVHEHRGQISCQNKPEGGAMFVLRFPAALETPVQVAAVAAR